MMSAVLAIRLLLPERHAEVREERFRVLIGPRRRDDVDVHAADLVDLVVDDLGEDHLLLEPERVVPSAVESLPRHALEVAHARQRDVDEPIEKLVHPRTTERHLRADRHALAQLEVRDRLLRARDDRLLPADRLQIGRREVEHLGVLPPLAHTHVDHDLLEARHLPRVRVPALLHQRRDHRLLERHLDPRRDLARALRTPLRDGRALRRARALLRLSLRRDDGDRVAPTDVARGRHQMTSGASEMIFANCRSRSSRATGPKMRVPTGFSSGLRSTTALRSKRMYEPSLRRTSFTVRTTTARATSPFFTVPSGAASFTATITVSPRDA